MRLEMWEDKILTVLLCKGCEEEFVDKFKPGK